MVLPADDAPKPKRKAKGKSPTARSLDLLRSRGYRAEVVEHWIPHTFITRDLFGFIDILAIREGEVLGVQACSSGGTSKRGSDVAARIRKIAESDAVGDVRKAGIGIHVHGWRKNAAGEWVCTEEDVS
jgi:hypothetical protein